MITWKGDEFLKHTENELVKNFVKAGVYFVSKERGYLNRAQPYVRKGKWLIGLDPSKPGEFPKKLSGQLQRSITWSFDRTKMILTVGSNLKKYPSFLETGTKRMQPRPWLTLGFNKEKNTIGRIIVGNR